jgi:hypothetical protein
MQSRRYFMDLDVGLCSIFQVNIFGRTIWAHLHPFDLGLDLDLESFPRKLLGFGAAM